MNEKMTNEPSIETINNMFQSFCIDIGYLTPMEQDELVRYMQEHMDTLLKGGESYGEAFMHCWIRLMERNDTCQS